MSHDKKELEILENEEEKMTNYLKWYLDLPGEYSGKIKINRKYANSIKEELRESKLPYPTKLVYMLNMDPNEYNKNYPKAVMYENYKLKAYTILYLNQQENEGWYDEDIGFSIGIELLFKEFVDNNPQWKELISHK